MMMCQDEQSKQTPRLLIMEARVCVPFWLNVSGVCGVAVARSLVRYPIHTHTHTAAAAPQHNISY